jgi:hypothetical protein
MEVVWGEGCIVHMNKHELRSAGLVDQCARRPQLQLKY